MSATSTPAPTPVSIPVIDFGLFDRDRAECARQIGQASTNIGFFYLQNHGLDKSLVDAMFDASQNFFQQPVENKNKHLIGAHNIGYSPMRSERLDPAHQKVGDNKEAYNIRKYSIEDDSTYYFVHGDESKQKQLVAFYKGLHKVANQVMQCFALALQVPDAHFFDASHQWSESSGTTLRFLHYPQQSGDPGTPLAGSHSDYGSMTCLLQRDIAGLEVQASRTDSEDVPWVAAPVIEDTILINIGDHLELWTNGLLRSTRHRVVYNKQQETQSRYSIACFIHAGDNEKLEPIPSPLVNKENNLEKTNNSQEDQLQRRIRDMTAKEYLNYKLDMTYGNYDHASLEQDQQSTAI